MAKKLPPILVSPWTKPIPIKTIFFNLKKVFLKEENFFLFKIKIDEKTKSKATNNLKSKRYLNFKAINKNIIKKGKQNKLYSVIKTLSFTFDLKNWRALIVIDTGINILIVLAKSYPSTKKDGVPNNNKPTPKIDWIIISNVMMIISKNSIGCV